MKQAMISLVIVVAALLSPSLLHAQHEYDVWYFAECGLDFRSTPARYVYNNDLFGLRLGMEGCAVMCDRQTGKILFGSNGVRVFNRDSKLMPNGDGLIGGGFPVPTTSSQAALIVPMPCDPYRYYLFTADQGPYNDLFFQNHGIHYSIVDMRLDNGLGDVAEKNVPLIDKASEHLTAVMHSNGHDFWVLTHSDKGDEFYAFLVSAEGVSTTPVVSKVGVVFSEDDEKFPIGYLKGSPDGRKLAMTLHLHPLVELYDFDPATGTVSNPLRLITEGDPRIDAKAFRGPYGVSFSPDGSRLYSGIQYMLQWSVDAGSPAAIKASETIVSDTTLNKNTIGGLQIGPDGKIYFLRYQQYVGVITNPNARGRACNVIDTLMAMNCKVQGLPNNIDTRSFFQRPYPGEPVSIASINRPDSCSPVIVTAVDGYTNYRWSDGQSGRSISAFTSGTYSVTATDSGGCTSAASVDVTVPSLLSVTINADGPLSFCQGDSVRLNAVVSGEYQSLQWSTGQTEPAITVGASGRYVVTAINTYGCIATDTVVVHAVSFGEMHLSLSRDSKGTPGDTVVITLRSKDRFDSVGVNRMELIVRFDSTLLRPLVSTNGDTSKQLAVGALLGGWSVQGEIIGAGLLRLVLEARDSTGVIDGTGEMLRIPFATFVTMGDVDTVQMESEVFLDVESANPSCLSWETSAGHVKLEMCGGDNRWIVAGLEKYALEPPHPNPFNPTTEITFALGLDGATRLEILDVIGRTVAVLVDEHLSEGGYRIAWNAGAYPSGLYYCRVTSGTWVQMVSLVLVK